MHPWSSLVTAISRLAFCYSAFWEQASKLGEILAGGALGMGEGEGWRVSNQREGACFLTP